MKCLIKTKSFSIGCLNYQLEKLNKISDDSSEEGRAGNGDNDDHVDSHVELHVQYVAGITGA